MKYFLIYMVTNLVNGKFYIGKHTTSNITDTYLGSGKIIKKAVRKYGRQNFRKDILLIFDNKEEMNNKEKELVNEDLLKDPNCYNIRPGGVGGFTLEESRKGTAAAKAAGNYGIRYSPLIINMEVILRAARLGGLANKGKPKSESHKQSIRNTWIRKKANGWTSKNNGSKSQKGIPRPRIEFTIQMPTGGIVITKNLKEWFHSLGYKGNVNWKYFENKGFKMISRTPLNKSLKSQSGEPGRI